MVLVHYDRDVIRANMLGNFRTMLEQVAQSAAMQLYLDNFTLPTNGPTSLEPERAYAFEYSNALFIILDTNLKLIERVLGRNRY